VHDYDCDCDDCYARELQQDLEDLEMVEAMLNGILEKLADPSYDGVRQGRSPAQELKRMEMELR